MRTRILLLTLFFLRMTTIDAQQNLETSKLFDAYGKQEGSILVQLSSDVLSQGSNITFYKSLITNESPEKARAFTEAIDKDLKSQSIRPFSEFRKGEKIEYGKYWAGKNAKNKQSEYILYKPNKGKLTLIYLKGNFEANELDNELKKLKGLIVLVNDKRIKLN